MKMVDDLFLKKDEEKLSGIYKFNFTENGTNINFHGSVKRSEAKHHRTSEVQL